MTAKALDSRSRSLPAPPSVRRRPGLLLTAWLLGFIGIAGLYELELLAPGWPRYAAAALHTVLGLLTLGSYVAFLRSCDELERKIHVEALALGFGVGALWMMAWRLFERAGAPQLDVNDGLLVMLGAYGIGVALARQRYA
jgi:hypothetical protein